MYTSKNPIPVPKVWTPCDEYSTLQNYGKSLGYAYEHSWTCAHPKSKNCQMKLKHSRNGIN